MHLDRLAGLAGVAPDETPRALAWGRYFEWPMLLVASWIPIQWYFEEAGVLDPAVSHVGNWIVWLFFVAETSVLVTLVRDKRRYLLHNWMNVAIIVAGLPIVWQYTPLVGLLRSLRLLLMLGLFLRASHSLRSMLSHERLAHTLAISFTVVVLAGVLISRIEPSIGNPWDGIWWAWVTVTTVGYGDVVPESPAGRLFGGLLILLGVGLFALMTASFSAFLVGRDKVREEQEMRGRLKDLQDRMERLEAGLKQLLEQQNAASREADKER